MGSKTTFIGNKTTFMGSKNDFYGQITTFMGSYPQSAKRHILKMCLMRFYF